MAESEWAAEEGSITTWKYGAPQPGGKGAHSCPYGFCTPSGASVRDGAAIVWIVLHIDRLLARIMRFHVVPEIRGDFQL